MGPGQLAKRVLEWTLLIIYTDTLALLFGSLSQTIHAAPLLALADTLIVIPLAQDLISGAIAINPPLLQSCRPSILPSHIAHLPNFIKHGSLYITLHFPPHSTSSLISHSTPLPRPVPRHFPHDSLFHARPLVAPIHSMPASADKCILRRTLLLLAACCMKTDCIESLPRHTWVLTEMIQEP